MTVFVEPGSSVSGESLYYHHFRNEPRVEADGKRLRGVLDGRGEVWVDIPLRVLGPKEARASIHRLSCRSATFECGRMTRPQYKPSGNHTGWRGYLREEAKATIRTSMR